MGILFGIVIFSLIFIADKQNMFVYSWRQQHSYLASAHRVIATFPTYITFTQTPIFCRSTETEPIGIKDC